MKRSLLDILACPIDKHYPLELYELESKGDIVVEGVLRCPKCNRYYPIIDEIPRMLPDNYRSRSEDLNFLKKYRDELPEKIVHEGKPYNLESE